MTLAMLVLAGTVSAEAISRMVPGQVMRFILPSLFLGMVSFGVMVWALYVIYRGD